MRCITCHNKSSRNRNFGITILPHFVSQTSKKTMSRFRTMMKTALAIVYALLAFPVVAFHSPLVFSFSSGLHASPAEFYDRLGASETIHTESPLRTKTTMTNRGVGNPGTVANTVDKSCGRRRILNAVMMAVVTCALPPESAFAARAETTETETITATKKSNFNYELGNDDCETSCKRSCELSSSKSSRNNYGISECKDACVRSGQRYCHQTMSSSKSPAAAEATTSRYVETTNEPQIVSSKPIPGFRYNSNRGGAWRDL